MVNGPEAQSSACSEPMTTEREQTGESPESVYAAAKASGLSTIDALRLLRSQFGLTLAAAKAVRELVDGPVNSGRPVLDTREQLLRVLSDELGYCDCASSEALAILTRLLRVVRERSDSTKNAEEFAKASREVEACLRLDVTAGLGEWFVYGLEQRGLVQHNFRLTDVWITDKGRWLLSALERLESSAAELPPEAPEEP
jgi:hypothetical protein